MTAHPHHHNPVELRLVLEALPSAERHLIAHLLGCSECRRALLQQLDWQRDPGGEPAGDPEERSGYDGALDKVFVRSEEAAREAAAQLAREQGECSYLLDELWGLQPAEWEDFFLRPLPLLFLRRVLDQASRILLTDPGVADTLARHVRKVVLRAFGRFGSPGVEVLARAWSITGSARARRSNWGAADAAFAEASSALADLSDLTAESELCRLLGDRFARQERVIEATALLANGAQLAGAGGQVADEIAGLAEVAQLLGRRGELDQAVGVLARALLRAEDAGLAASASQLRLRLAWTLRQLGRFRDAAAVTPAAHPALGSADSWVFQGLVHFHRGEMAQAEEALRPAADAALLEGDAALAALALLNLLSLLALEERSADMPILAAPLRLLAEAEADLAPEVRAALAALYEALQSESGSVGALVLAATAALDLHQDPDA